MLKWLLPLRCGGTGNSRFLFKKSFFISNTHLKGADSRDL